MDYTAMHSIQTYRNATLPPAPPACRKAIVFIHGIFSDHRTFSTMMETFSQDPRFADWDLAWFDYNFYQEMSASAQFLVGALQQAYSGHYDNVVFVCHSMGGLIARLAVMNGGVPFVTKLIMLGTPNFGAVRTGSMALLAQATAAGGQYLFGLYPRKSGIIDLTRVPSVFKPYLKPAPPQGPPNPNLANAAGVYYVTIPGLYFNEERGWFGGDMTRQKVAKSRVWELCFRVGNIALEIWNSLTSLWNVQFRLPHDGIVEEASNSLVPATAAHRSEKSPQINHPAKYPNPSYAHVTHDVCSDLVHVTLQGDPYIIELVASIAVAVSLAQWHTNIQLSSFSDALRVQFQ